MTFSVIIPVWNQAEYLPDALDSVLDQTYKDFEIICVNDGSPDESSAIAKHYQKMHPKVRIKVIDQVNKGLASARNTGIMNASGEYCLMLDADDILLEECLEHMAHAAEKLSPDIIAPSFKHFGIYNDELMLGGVPTLQDFKVANRLPYFCAFKRSILLECGGYSPKMTWGFEDYHLHMDLFSRAKSVHIIQIPLVLYRTKETSMLTEANKHSAELLTQMATDFPHVYA